MRAGVPRRPPRCALVRVVPAVRRVPGVAFPARGRGGVRGGERARVLREGRGGVRMGVRDDVAWKVAVSRVACCPGCGVLVVRDWPKSHACTKQR